MLDIKRVCQGECLISLFQTDDHRHVDKLCVVYGTVVVVIFVVDR